MQLGTILRFKNKYRANGRDVEAGTIAMINSIDSSKPNEIGIICENGLVFWDFVYDIKIGCDIINFSNKTND